MIGHITSPWSKAFWWFAICQVPYMPLLQLSTWGLVIGCAYKCWSRKVKNMQLLNFLIGIFCWPWQGKDIVYRFIVEYSSSMDFYRPLASRSIFIWGFLNHDILGLCWNLRLVIELWYLERFWFSFKGFFLRIIFWYGEIFEFP